MGQKSNSISIRLGKKKNLWQSKYIAKNSEEPSLYVFQNLNIKQYLEKILKLHGLKLHDCKLFYCDNKLDISVSYYVGKDTYSLIKQSTSSNINLKFNLKNNSKLIVNNKNSWTRNSKIKIIKHQINKKKFLNINELNLNNFGSEIVANLNKYTNFKYNISIFFIDLTKNSTLKATHLNQNIFKKTILTLRKYSKVSFFPEMVNIISIVVTKRKSAKLLSDFIGVCFSSLKRHNYFLGVLKHTSKLFVRSHFSIIKGIKIIISGRFNGAPRARHRIITIGSVPLQTVQENIHFSNSVAFTPNGTFGIKVWVCEK